LPTAEADDADLGLLASLGWYVLILTTHFPL
jgi:hypothetical protein